MTTEVTTLTLESGTQIEIVPLKTRQFFRLMKIVTHGAGEAIANLNLDLAEEEFVLKLLATVVFAIPDAENETIDFLQSMVSPVGLRTGVILNKQDREYNANLWAGLDVELANPEIGDTISIIEAVVKREGEDLQALGKRLMSMFSIAEKTGQLVPQEAAEADIPEQAATKPSKSKKSADEE